MIEEKSQLTQEKRTWNADRDKVGRILALSMLVPYEYISLRKSWGWVKERNTPGMYGPIFDPLVDGLKEIWMRSDPIFEYRPLENMTAWRVDIFI